MTTPPSDPYGTPPSESEDRSPQQPPPYPGSAAGEPPSWRETPPAQAEPPASILAAVRLMYVGAGLSLLWTVLLLPQRDAIREELAGQDLDMTESEIESAATTFIWSLALLGVLTIALWLWMAFANRRGHAWARIVATVLGVIAILFTLFSTLSVIGLGQGVNISVLLNVALIALAVAILFLLYRPDSNEYYRAMTRQSRY